MNSARLRLRTVVCVGLVSSLVVAPTAVAQTDTTVEFSVTNFTDLHGHFEESDRLKEIGAAKLAALVEKVNEGQEYALTSSGDNVGGSAFVSAVAEDVPTMKMMNAMGVDATAVGNHELDRGIGDLQGRIADNTDFPHLAANIYRDGERVLPALEIEELNGVKVAFVGSVTEETPTIVQPAGVAGLEFRDPVAETNAEAKRLKESGEADVVIALFHDDVESHKADFGPEVDVVFGGHSHLRAMGEVARPGALPLYYAQGQSFGKVLSDYDFTFNTSTKQLESVKAAQYDYADAAALSPDPGIAQMVAKAKEDAAELGARVVGRVEDPLTKPSAPGAEGTFSNFIATAQREVMGQLTGDPVDLGIMNEGGVRTELEAGDITYEDAHTAQPFANELQVGTLSGQDILDTLELQWRADSDRVTILGFSEGFSYAYDAAAKPGERILGATINGQPLDPAKDYRVAAASFLFGGGDGFASLKNARDLVSPGILDVEALIKYLETSPVVPAAQAGVGVKLPEQLEAGKDAAIELYSLNYSGTGDAQAKTAKVTLGEATATAPISNEEVSADEGNLGTARVELEVPADLSGEQTLIIETDPGTKVAVPITVGAGEPGDGAGDGAGDSDDSGAGSSQSGSSKHDEAGASSMAGRAGIIAALVAAVAAEFGTVLMPQLPQLKAQLERLLGALRV